MNPVWHFLNGVPTIGRAAIGTLLTSRVEGDGTTLGIGYDSTDRLNLTSAGLTWVGTGYTITSSVASGWSAQNLSFAEISSVTGFLRFTSRFELLPGGATGLAIIRNAAQDAGVGLDFATDGILKIRNRAHGADGALSVGGGTTTIAPLTIGSGTNLTVASANAVENDGAALYFTHDTTNGRKYNDNWNYFRLTGSGTGITTIADFFGSSDGIPLVAGGVYEIEWYCYFSQVTAGTATWTVVTATTALANITGEYWGSNIAGIGTVGAPQTAAINATTSSSTAFPVTGTEATGVTHFFVIRCLVTAGAGASNTRLRLTMSAGTATPLINSYFRVRRLAAANVGTFVA